MSDQNPIDKNLQEALRNTLKQLDTVYDSDAFSLLGGSLPPVKQGMDQYESLKNILGLNDETVINDPNKKILGNQTKADLMQLNEITDLSNRTADDQFFRRIGTDKGLMDYYDKALQSRKNDRLLEGANLIANYFNRAALINKL